MSFTDMSPDETRNARVALFNQIDVRIVRDALLGNGFSPICLSGERKASKSSFDVAINEFGIEYRMAQRYFSDLFPEICDLARRLDARPFTRTEQDAAAFFENAGVKYRPLPPGVCSMGKKRALARLGGDRALYLARRCIHEQYRAFQVERMDIIACLPERMRKLGRNREALKLVSMQRAIHDGVISGFTNSDERIAEFHGYFSDIPSAPRTFGRSGVFRNVDIHNAFRIVPLLQAINMLGSLGPENAANIYCAPRWPEDKIPILVNDFRCCHWDKRQNDPAAEKFLLDCPPTAILATSDRFPQVLWLINRRHEPEFYEVLMDEMNREFGDGSANARNYGRSRLAGFFNQKAACHDKASGREFPLTDIARFTTSYPREFEDFADRRHAGWKREGSRPTDRQRGRAFQETLGFVDLDEAVVKKGLEIQTEVMEYMRFFKDGDRSKIDYRTASGLYRCKATPDEVFTFLCRYGVQDERWIRKNGNGGEQWMRNVTDSSDRERKARRTAMNANPALDFSYASLKGVNAEDLWYTRWRHLVSPIIRKSDREEKERLFQTLAKERPGRLRRIY